MKLKLKLSLGNLDKLLSILPYLQSNNNYNDKTCTWQGVTHFKDIQYNSMAKYGDILLQQEYEMSCFNLEHASRDTYNQLYNLYEKVDCPSECLLQGFVPSCRSDKPKRQTTQGTLMPVPSTGVFILAYWLFNRHKNFTSICTKLWTSCVNHKCWMADYLLLNQRDAAGGRRFNREETSHSRIPASSQAESLLQRPGCTWCGGSHSESKVLRYDEAPCQRHSRYGASNLLKGRSSPLAPPRVDGSHVCTSI